MLRTNSPADVAATGLIRADTGDGITATIPVTPPAVEAFDSGWIEITSSLTDQPSSGGAYVRRIGNAVYFDALEVTYDTAASIKTWGNLAAGFRPSLSTAEFPSSLRLQADSTVGFRISQNGNMYAYRVRAGEAFRGTGSWPTDDPVPNPVVLPLVTPDLEEEPAV